MDSYGLAIYGALLSTVLAVLRVMEWWQNRPRIVVNQSFGVRFRHTGSLAHTIVFQAHNVGSRPTTLTSFFFLLAGGVISSPLVELPPVSVIEPPLPARLDPGGVVTASVLRDTLHENVVDPPYAQVGFRDARGAAHYCVRGLKGWMIRRRLHRMDRRAYAQEFVRRNRQRIEQKAEQHPE